MRSTHDIKSLTGLRGIAAVYVLVFHYFPLTTYASPLKRVVAHGYLAVDLFFVLSGFVMALNYGHLFAPGWSLSAYLTFLGRRVARIYPLYLVATLTGFVFVVAGFLPYQPGAVGVPLLFNLLMIQAWGLASSFDSPAWSISAEWAAYLLFPALLVPALFRKPVAAWLTALVCAGVLAALCALPRSMLPDYLLKNPLNMNGYWLGLPVLRCVPEFTLGVLAFRVAATPFGGRLASSGWIAPVLSLCALLTVALPEKGDLALILLLPLLVVSLTSDAHWSGRILAAPVVEFVGKLSFSIYLTHKLLYGLLTWLYLQAHAAGIPHARSCAAAVCIGATLVISLFAYRFIEVPGRKVLRDVLGRRARGIALAHPAASAVSNEG